ncbi:MAG: hypothetical protein QXW97_03970 [Candidatus Pacearchaeota archaeon]
MFKKILFIILIFLIIPNVFANSTEIKVKTLPNHRILLTILVPEEQESYKVIESSSPFRDTSILGLYNYETTSKTSLYPKIDIKITLKLDNNIILNERLKNITTGRVIYINYFPKNISISYDDKNFEKVSFLEDLSDKNNTSINNTFDNKSGAITSVSLLANEMNKSVNEGELEKNNSNDNFITMKSIINSKNKTFVSKIIIYISVGFIFGIIIVVIIFFIIKKKISTSNKKSLVKFKLKYGSEDYNETERKLQDIERKLENEENKLKELKDEINKIKNKNELIKEVEKKLEEDRKMLDKLKNEKF